MGTISEYMHNLVLGVSLGNEPFTLESKIAELENQLRDERDSHRNTKKLLENMVRAKGNRHA